MAFYIAMRWEMLALVGRFVEKSSAFEIGMQSCDYLNLQFRARPRYTIGPLTFTVGSLRNIQSTISGK